MTKHNHCVVVYVGHITDNAKLQFVVTDERLLHVMVMVGPSLG